MENRKQRNKDRDSIVDLDDLLPPRDFGVDFGDSDDELELEFDENDFDKEGAPRTRSQVIRESTYDAIDGYEDSDEETRNRTSTTTSYEENNDNRSSYHEPPNIHEQEQHSYHQQHTQPQPHTQHQQHTQHQPHTQHQHHHEPSSEYNHNQHAIFSENQNYQRQQQPAVVERPSVKQVNTGNDEIVPQDQKLLQEIFSISLVYGDNISGYELRVTQQGAVERRQRDPDSMEEIVTNIGQAKLTEVLVLRKLFLTDWDNIKMTLSRRGRARSDGESIMFREGLTDRSTWIFNAGNPPPEMQKIYNHLKQFFSGYNYF